MKFKEIISKLEEIEGSLDDAFYSLPEYNSNVDSRDYIDSARNELYCLKEDIEKKLIPVITGDRDTDSLLEDERRNQEKT